MKCETEGIVYNKGYKSPICVDRVDNLHSEIKCYKVIILESGKNLLFKNDIEREVAGPAIICLNENEDIEIKKEKLKVIYFHPFLINSILTYENMIHNNNPDEKISDGQDRYMLVPFTERNDSFDGVIHLDDEAYSIIVRLFFNVEMELNEQIDLFWPCRSRSYLLEMLIFLNRLISEKSEKDDKSNRVTELVDYLHKNYNEKITLEDLSLKFATNRTTLNNEFIKATGSSIIDYLIKLRVELACAMLRDTRIPISEIMYRVGYNDSANFWRIFKKNIGLSPSEYRNQNCLVD